MFEQIINDIETKLNVKINKETLEHYKDGKSDSIVISLEDKYLIKTVDENTYKTQKKFLTLYEDIDNFQTILCDSSDLKYICYKFMFGEKLEKVEDINPQKIVDDLYIITNSYKKIDAPGFGYLEEANKSWETFLSDEVEYGYYELIELSIPMEKVNKALEKIKTYEIDKYLIHGDFGTHNFLFDNDYINVIDPMPVVGDRLYDFYYAVTSDVRIFNKVDIDYILSFYDEDMEYKKLLFIICLYIRMSRAYKYDRGSFKTYKDLYLSFEL